MKLTKIAALVLATATTSAFAASALTIDVGHETITNAHTSKVGGASTEVSKGEDVVRNKALLGGASTQVSKGEDVFSRGRITAGSTAVYSDVNKGETIQNVQRPAKGAAVVTSEPQAIFGASQPRSTALTTDVGHETESNRHTAKVGGASTEVKGADVVTSTPLAGGASAEVAKIVKETTLQRPAKGSTALTSEVFSETESNAHTAKVGGASTEVKGAGVVTSTPLLGGASIEVDDRVPEFHVQRPVATTTTVVTDVTRETESNAHTAKVGSAVVVEDRVPEFHVQRPVATKTNTVNEAPNEGQLHASRYYGPIHNADSLAHAQELAHDPRYVTSGEGKHAAAIAEKAATIKLTQEKIAEDRAAAQKMDANAPAGKDVFLQANSRVELVGHKAAPLQANAPRGERALVGTGGLVATSTPTAQQIDSEITPISQQVATNTRKLVAVDTQSMEAQQRSIDNKADIATLTTTVGTKADQTAVDAVQTDLATTRTNLNHQVVAIEDKLKLKSDQTALDTEIAARKRDDATLKTITDTHETILNQTVAPALQQNTADIKTLKTDLATTTNTLGTKIQAKADQTAVDANSKLIADNTTAIGTKADQTAVDANKADIATNKTAIADNGKLISDNTTAIDGNKTSLNALQQRVTLDEQYDGDAISKNRQDIAANTSALTTKADQTAVDANSKLIASNTTATQNNATAIKGNTTAIQTETARATAAESRIEGKADTNAKGIAANKSALTTKVDTTTFTADQKRQDARIDTNTQSISKHETRITRNERTLSNHENRISNLEANQGYGNRFESLKKDVEQNRKHASAGIAGVAAMANIPQVSQGATFSVGAGAGTYDGEQGLAVGASARIGSQVVTKFSVSATTQHDFVAGAGVSYEW
ncbi:YadA C-terminal domain-containing protein [Salmonella enterica]|nr:YadA C-terminal domain-containing protein [Salmonella enterica]